MLWMPTKKAFPISISALYLPPERTEIYSRHAVSFWTGALFEKHDELELSEINEVPTGARQGGYHLVQAARGCFSAMFECIAMIESRSGVERHSTDWCPVARMARPARRIAFTRRLVQCVTRREDYVIVASMALRRTHVTDAAVTMLEIVTVHERGSPGTGCAQIIETRSG